MLIGIHHPAEYRVIESWSGYFEPTNPAGEPEDLGSTSRNAYASAHASVPKLKGELARYPGTFIGFYIGDKDPYPGFVADNVRLSRELTKAGIPHVFRIYPGAHDDAFWDAHQDAWLAAAVDLLARPS